MDKVNLGAGIGLVVGGEPAMDQASWYHGFEIHNDFVLTRWIA